MNNIDWEELILLLQLQCIDEWLEERNIVCSYILYSRYNIFK